MANATTISVIDSTGTTQTVSTLDAALQSSMPVNIVDEYGNDVEATPLNQLRVADTIRLAGANFGSALDSNYWVSAVANGGANTVANNQITQSLTTTSGSSANIVSASLARFINGSANYFRGVIRLGDVGAANNVRLWGAVDAATPTNGFYFKLSGTTFSVVRAVNSSATVVDSGSFNGSVASYSVDTNYHVWEIYYDAFTTTFAIDGVVIHRFTATTAQLSGILHLKPILSNANTGVGTAVSIYAISCFICRLGPADSQQKYYHIAGANAGVQLKTGPGRLRRIIVNTATNATIVSVYDATSATNALAILNYAANSPAASIDYDCEFYTGLYVVTAGASTDVTFVYE